MYSGKFTIEGRGIRNVKIGHGTRRVKKNEACLRDLRSTIKNTNKKVKKVTEEECEKNGKTIP